MASGDYIIKLELFDSHWVAKVIEAYQIGNYLFS